MDTTLAAARALIETTLREARPGDLAQPIPGKWSSGQVLEHLRLSYHFTTVAIERVLAGETRSLRSPTLAQRLARWVVIDIGYFPRVEAPAAVKPGDAPVAAGILNDVLTALEQMDDALARAERQLGADTPVINHPRFAAMTVAQWRRFHLSHTRHHVRQAKERLGR